MWIRIISIAIAVVSFIVFFITEDMNNTWVWVDRWTLVMSIFFLASVVMAVLAKHKKDEIEE